MRIQDIVDLANARSTGYDLDDLFDEDELEQETEEQLNLRERLAEGFRNAVNQRREYDSQGSDDEGDEGEVYNDEVEDY